MSDITDKKTEKVSKNEEKRRLKAEQKAKEKAVKEEAKKAEALQAQAISSKKNVIKDEDISPNEYFKIRSNFVSHLKSSGDNPYPHKFHVTISLQNFIDKYITAVTDGEVLEEECSIAGRVHSIRLSGTKLIFYDLRGEGVKIQVLANAKFYQDENAFAEDTAKIKRGDIIGIVGRPAKSKKGEFSIIPKSIVLLSPCLHMLPHLYYGLKEKVREKPFARNL